MTPLDTPSSSITATEPQTVFLSVIIPAYNEETRLAQSLPQILDYLRQHFVHHEVIVVDDGSTDRTAVIAESHGVRVLRLERNSGKGAAVRAGMLAATGDFVLFTDADLSTPITEIEKAFRHIAAGADVVIGSRALPESDVQVHQNFVRELMGKTFNLFVRLIAGLPFPDTQCGFKCFRHFAAQEIFRRASIPGFAFDVEVLVLARLLKLRTVEMPVRWVNSPASKVGMLVHPLQMLRDIVRVRWNEMRGRYN